MDMARRYHCNCYYWISYNRFSKHLVYTWWNRCLDCLCFSLNQTIQIIIFIILSVICIGISRPLAKKYLRTQTVSTNYDRVIGQHGLVLKRIDADTRGEVKVLSMEWSASSVDNSTLEEGDYCEILAVEGAHLVVKKINK